MLTEVGKSAVEEASPRREKGEREREGGRERASRWEREGDELNERGTRHLVSSERG